MIKFQIEFCIVTLFDNPVLFFLLFLYVVSTVSFDIRAI